MIIWVRGNCNPKKIPTGLSELGLKDGNYSYTDIVEEINLQTKKLVLSFIQEDEGIQRFLDLLKSASVKKDGVVAQGGKFYINSSHFILSDGLKQSLLDEFVLIEKDNRRLAALIIVVEENFSELWNYCPGGKVQSLPSCLSVIDKRYDKFSILMNSRIDKIEESPNCDSSGAYSEYYFSVFRVYTKFSSGNYNYPLKVLKDKFNGDGYMHFRYSDGDDSMEKTLSLEVLIAYGLEKAEMLYKNLLASVSLIEKASATGYIKRMLNKFCYGKYEELKVKPEITAFIDKLIDKQDPSVILNYDLDIEREIIVYLSGRSESGGSGGVGQISQIIIWSNGQETMKEFTYRDRYSGSNDNYAYNFKAVKIVSVSDNGEFLDIEVEASPYEERFSSTRANFQIKHEVKDSAPSLSQEEQDNFVFLFKKLKEEKLSELRELHSHRTGTCMNKDYSGYVPYPDSQISTSIMKTENGVGAFVTKECIDHRVTNLQWRYTLYLVQAQELEQIFQDNSYEDAGDASVYGLEFFSHQLNYSTRTRRQKHKLI